MLFLAASALLTLSSTASVRAFTGDVTFYTPGLGACGIHNMENDFIAAIAHHTFDTYPGAGPNPNKNPICGKNLKATCRDGGKSVVVKFVDRCGGCKGVHDVDMTPIAFRVLVNQGQGRLHGVHWNWTNSTPGPVALEETDRLVADTNVV